MIDRRTWSAAMLGAWALPRAARASDVAAGSNFLRVPFESAETGFDPAQISDLYSARVTAHIFEALYRYDWLALPVKIKPLTAAALPEVSDDYREWTIRVRPGIYFADDPAFGGQPRELVAADYAYSFKRIFDPATRSPSYSSLREDGPIGFEELRAAALRDRKPFDYDTPVEGARVLDRYTLRMRLAEPRPRFLTTLCTSAIMGAVAREVVQRYGGEIMAHPVGTGPYRLGAWRRSSRIVLERNPGFREMRIDAEPAEGDAAGQAWAARYRGRRLPLNEGVEIAVLEEGQARWLAFLNGEVDYVRVPPEFTNIVMPGGSLAPNLVKRGIQARRFVNPDFTMSYFNMDDPVVGGYTPDKVALRRAVGLSYDTAREIRVVRRGSAIAAQAPMAPGTFGYDPLLRTEQGECDPARAKALLDLYGYVDRDGDGWREQPDGTPLVLQMATQTSNIERQLNEVWQKSAAAIGVRMVFEFGQWPEHMKQARAGKLQMWGLGSTSGADAQGALEYMYGPSIGSGNLARFRNDAFDALYRRMLVLPDGPERGALFREAAKIITAYMPYKTHVHRVYNDLSQPWLTGWREAPFRRESWMYAEVDGARRDAARG